MKKHIICMKWGTKFGARYVNRLYRMIRSNITGDWELTCFTENGEGIDPAVRVLPLPELDLDAKLPERGWRKLTVLGDSLTRHFEQSVLFLDLDVQIVGNIDEFFERPGEFLIGKDPDFPKDIIGNSSVFRVEVGKHRDILDYYIDNGDAVRARHRNEQAYLSYAMHDKGILQYWPAEWVVSFKRQCVKPFPLNYFVDPAHDSAAKIVMFHGKPLPEQAITGYTGKCGFRRVRPTNWVTKFDE